MSHHHFRDRRNYVTARTLEEAFGFGIRHHIHTETPRSCRTARIGYAVMLIIALAGCVLLQGCGRKPPDPNAVHVAPVPAKIDDVIKVGPDEFGVVCYSRHYSSLSCVKVINN